MPLLLIIVTLTLTQVEPAAGAVMAAMLRVSREHELHAVEDRSVPVSDAEVQVRETGPTTLATHVLRACTGWWSRPSEAPRCWALTHHTRTAGCFDVVKQPQRCVPAHLPQARVVSIEESRTNLEHRFSLPSPPVHPPPLPLLAAVQQLRHLNCSVQLVISGVI
jgi:hypothetical protein